MAWPKGEPRRYEATSYKDTVWYQSYEARKARKEKIEQERKQASKQARLDRKTKYPERRVDRAFVLAVEAAGGFTTKMHPMSNSGIPDRILHYHRRTYYVEMKTTGEPCSPLQIEMHKRLHEQGIPVYVLDTQIKNILELWDFVYTTYPSDHYHKNPHKDVTE